MKPKNNTLSKEELNEKANYWAGIFFRTLREEDKIDISLYREVEPNIDLLLNDIFEELYWGSGYKTKEIMIEEDFILDEQAKKYLENLEENILKEEIQETKSKVNDILKNKEE